MYVKKINEYKNYIKSKYMILESMSIGYDELINSIKANKISYNNDNVLSKILNSNSSLEEIISKSNFKRYWDNKDLYSSEIFNSDDYSTFLTKPISFIFIYKDGDLPVYLIIKGNDDTSTPILYEVGESEVNDFLDRLSSKIIYIKYNNYTYTYQTSNGEDWIKTKGPKSKKFPNELSIDELKNITSEDGVDVTIE